MFKGDQEIVMSKSIKRRDILVRIFSSSLLFFRAFFIKLSTLPINHQDFSRTLNVLQEAQGSLGKSIALNIFSHNNANIPNKL